MKIKRWRRLAISLTVFLCGLIMSNAPAMAGDVGRGRLLYDGQCTSCHATSVHTRAARRATDYAGVVAQVRRWSEAISAGFSERDLNDVASYLNVRYYRYICPAKYCNHFGAVPHK